MATDTKTCWYPRRTSKKKVLNHPLASRRVTQPYGVPNSWYPQTGHHVGTDYATIVGTPLHAPFDGEITQTGISETLGNYCHYTYTYKGQKYVTRFLHLRETPRRGTYKQGDTIAYTGNTGFSTGPHVCIQVFKDEVNIPKLTADNFRQYTVDAELHYGDK